MKEVDKIKDYFNFGEFETGIILAFSQNISDAKIVEYLLGYFKQKERTEGLEIYENSEINLQIFDLKIKLSFYCNFTRCIAATKVDLESEYLKNSSSGSSVYIALRTMFKRLIEQQREQIQQTKN